MTSEVSVNLSSTKMGNNLEIIGSLNKQTLVCQSILSNFKLILPIFLRFEE